MSPGDVLACLFWLVLCLVIRKEYLNTRRDEATKWIDHLAKEARRHARL